MKERYFVSLVMILLLMVLATNVSPVRSKPSAPPLLPGATMAPNAVVVNGPPTTSLTWVKGSSAPVVNGNPTPPPDAPPISAGVVSASGPPVVPGGHWYQGSDYAGTSMLSNWVFAETSVPSTLLPDLREFYYVILSIWDSTGSYDQIGFANDYGIWGLAWSFTTGPCTSLTYHYTPFQFPLRPGQEYLFAITTASAPLMYEEAYTVSTTGAFTLIFALSVNNGVTSPGLEQAAGYVCSPTVTYYDYTDYEEVYGTTTYAQPDPYLAPGGLEFYFHENSYLVTVSGTATFTPWTAWWSTNAPGTPEGPATIDGELVFIHNIALTP